MREGWREAKLGDLFEPSNARLGPHDSEPTVLSISKYDGVMPSDEFFGKRVASAKLDDYKVLLEDAWVYSTIHIDEGSIARNTAGTGGVVSPMYTVMKWISEVDEPSYAELLVRSAEMRAAYADNAQGSINRRRSLPWKAFRSIPINLPPRDEQRRIVDLIGAVDNAVAAAEAEESAARLCRMDSLRAFAARRPTHLSTLASLTSLVIGGVWGEAPTGSGDVAVFGGSAFRNETTVLELKTAKFRTIGAGALQKRQLQPGDIVLEVSGGSATQPVGRVARVVDPLPAAVPSNFMRLVRPAWEPVGGYLYWVMWLRYAMGETKTYQRNTTGIRNLQVPMYMESETEVLTSPDDRALFVAIAESTTALIDAARGTSDSLRALRSNLLTVLLSGEHVIPSAYDALIEGEVA